MSDSSPDRALIILSTVPGATVDAEISLAIVLGVDFL